MKPDSLIDRLYRSSFNRKLVRGWNSNEAMRHALQSAHRFIITDERMARFMAELSNEAFLKHQNNNLLQHKIIDSLRVQSRLPYEAVWIEYPLKVYQYRSCELRSKLTENDPAHQPDVEGWLIQQHPKINSAHIIHIFAEEKGNFDSLGFDAWTYPFAFAWACDDIPLPWHQRIDLKDKWGNYRSAGMLTGIQNYQSNNVGIVESPLVSKGYNIEQLGHKTAIDLLTEWIGVLRRVWALLATLDHLPLTFGQIRLAKGFLARGRIRPYLEHRTITLNIPAKKDTRMIARQAIAIAHRKRHEVRAHWRDHWKYPLGTCNPHLWECVGNNPDLIECEICHGRQSYIPKHERGDAAIGWVKHDYEL